MRNGQLEKQYLLIAKILICEYLFYPCHLCAKIEHGSHECDGFTRIYI